MTAILTARSADGFEIWVLVPDYAKFQEHFPACVEHLKEFCALRHSQVKIWLGSSRGLRAAELLVAPHEHNNARARIYKSFVGRFSQPVLRRASLDGEVDYFEPTAEGFTRYSQPESDQFERALAK